MKRLLPLLLLPLAGCAVVPPPPPDPGFVAVRPQVALPPPRQDGGLYRDGYGASLFTDPSARNVGDLITVILEERTQAKKSASTSADKQQTLDIPSPTLFGGKVGYRGQEVLSASLAAKRQFKGKGDSAQSNSLTGRITVTVAEVLPNGNLWVQGEKRLTLNEGSEFIRFSGVVRPEDIRGDNTVLSSQVGDATIVYSGRGTLADVNRPGWLARIMNSPWWPF